MEPIYQITVWAFRCLRCGHEWLPRKPLTGEERPEGRGLPRICPKCKSPYWDREKQQDAGSG
jgi:hypothetical protein